MADRRRVHNDRAAVLMDRLKVVKSFWPLIKHRYSEEAQAAGDAAFEEMRLADLRAIEAAEMTTTERLISETESHRARAVLRNAAKVSRRTLAMIALAERPPLDLGNTPVRIPSGMLVDSGYPLMERKARQAERRAAIEAAKAKLLQRIADGEEPKDRYLEALHRTPREDLLRQRAEVLRAMLQAEQEALDARAELAAQVAAGEVVFAEDDLAVFDD